MSRTVGDVIADLRVLVDLPGEDDEAALIREAADLLEQCVPSSALVEDPHR